MAKELEGLQNSVFKKGNSMEDLSHEFLERWEKQHGEGLKTGALFYSL